MHGRRPRPPALGLRHVDGDPRRVLDLVVPDVAHHADHGTVDADLLAAVAVGVLALERHPFADRVLAGPELLRHRLVDDADQRRALPVGFAEAAAAQQRDAEGSEVVRRHHVEEHRLEVLRLRRHPFRYDPLLPAVALKRHDLGERRGTHAGQRLDPVEEAVVEAPGVFLPLVAGPRQRHAAGEDVVGHESLVHVLQSLQALDQ